MDNGVNTYDVKARLFKKGELGKSYKKYIDIDSFRDLVNSPRMQKDLEEGKLLGLLSHEGRARARASNLPHCDIVATDPQCLWVMKSITEEPDGFYGGFNFLKNSKAAQEVKDLHKAGTKLYISISTKLDEAPDRYYIRNLYGADLTLRPEFGSAEVLDANFDFSEGKIRELDNIELSYDTDLDFSLKEYIKERQMYRPYLYFRRRVQEVIRYLKFNKPATIQYNREYIIRYITEYLLEWIQRSYNDPDNRFNLMFELKLSDYCANVQAIRQLQIFLQRARSEVSAQKQISKVTQSKINELYNIVCDGIIDYINSKIKNEEKHL